VSYRGDVELGHSTLAVTDRYLRDVAPMHVIDTMRAPQGVVGRVRRRAGPAAANRVSGDGRA
jgi:hypothetical protein